MQALKSSLPRTLRTLAACIAILAGYPAAAADATVAPAAQPEKFTYIVVLHDRATNAGHEPPAEPDIPAMGGEVVERWRNRRVIRMPANAVRALVAHRAVKYIQRVQTGGPLPAVPRASAIASDAGIATDWAPPTWSSGTYVYDSEGNITGIGPGSDGGSETFTYDSAGRLVKAVTTHTGTHSEQYAYDSFGNLVSTTRTAGPSTATPADPATNRLQGTDYDGAGNVALAEGGTAEYYYDGLNMLRAKNTSSGVAWYLYTAGDERIGVQENGQSRWMIRDLSGKVLREWEGTNTWAWVEDYVHRGGTLAAAEREPAEGGTRHFHVDHLGTPRLITDAAGAKVALHDYFPFGVEQTDFRQEMLERGTDRPEPMKFTGHERDFTAGVETNNRNQLDYMHARYYSPVWGRFLSVDPMLDVKAALTQPQMWNRYTYVRDNPVNANDPTGRREALVYGQQLDVEPGDVILLRNKKTKKVVHVVVVGAFATVRGQNLPSALVYENAPVRGDANNSVARLADSKAHQPRLVDSNSAAAGGVAGWNRFNYGLPYAVSNRNPVMGFFSTPFTEGAVAAAVGRVGPVQYNNQYNGTLGPICDCAGYANQILRELGGTLSGEELFGGGMTKTDWERSVQ